jgi:hypothetical protein
MRQPIRPSILAASVVALAALAACGMPFANEATPASLPTIAAGSTSTPTTDASPTPVVTAALTSAPADTPTQATPAPTQKPPDTPAPPTPTLEPLVSNTIPDDGQYDDELPFRTRANDPGVGENSGDGIANVTFQFFGPDGQEIYNRTEQNTLYCAFGGGDDGEHCDEWIFSEHNNQWPNGQPAQSGPHTLIVTIYGARGGIAQEQRNVTLRLGQAPSEPTPTLEPLVSNSFPSGDTFGDELAFQTFANDLSVGGENGAGIDNVRFRVVDGQGQTVHERTERNPLYCAFGGGDDLQNCEVWRFSEHGGQWPSGLPVENGGTYRLQVTVTATSGRTVSEELVFTIQL